MTMEQILEMITAIAHCSYCHVTTDGSALWLTIRDDDCTTADEDLVDEIEELLEEAATDVQDGYTYREFEFDGFMVHLTWESYDD